MRIGHGYDAHRFGGERPFVIGGVRIPYERGISAHSDGDTLAHAVIDSLFGAAGMRDIGFHYPDKGEEYDGADSLSLLRDAVARISAKGFSIEYIDCTVVAQAPKMSAYIDAMRENLAAACSIAAARVNVKATTEEKMGFTGAGEGIAAHAVCLLTE
ncbi:MAG: 2-C-methyl-D-erythritol 2,4-cyclodiphosphate synthase [Clostridia bacterium]|nr:2-C-methyl-D-erythritol 2,4-cyclodiphosphate synthase [Clostridia bacterium]